jgi:hypothetical protein
MASAYEREMFEKYAVIVGTGRIQGYAVHWPWRKGRMCTYSDERSRHYLLRAEELRVAAEGVQDPDTRQLLLRVITDYEKMAVAVHGIEPLPHPSEIDGSRFWAEKRPDVLNGKTGFTRFGFLSRPARKKPAALERVSAAEGVASAEKERAGLALVTAEKDPAGLPKLLPSSQRSRAEPAGECAHSFVCTACGHSVDKRALAQMLWHEEKRRRPITEAEPAEFAVARLQAR